jgi:hypothetical protein
MVKAGEHERDRSQGESDEEVIEERDGFLTGGGVSRRDGS